VISDKFTGQSRGFGFVEMGSGSEAQAAISGLNGRQYGGRSLVVNEAKPQTDRKKATHQCAAIFCVRLGRGAFARAGDQTEHKQKGAQPDSCAPFAYFNRAAG